MVEDIPKLKALGIQVAIGHSGADYDTARAAVANGAMASTHTGNAMKLLHQHFPAIWGAVLEDDRVYCEVICDGRHLHPGTVRLILKTKGLERVVAVTDSIMAAGLPDGEYRLGVNEVVVIDGDAKLKENGTRAGSYLDFGKSTEKSDLPLQGGRQRSLFRFSQKIRQSFWAWMARGDLSARDFSQTLWCWMRMMG